MSVGAYGLRLSGIEADLLVPAQADWPAVEIVRRVGEPTFGGDRVGDDRAEIALRTGGDVVVERDPPRAEYILPFPIEDGELAHPYLAPVAAVIGRWLGRESFHAGAFVAAGGVWGVLGDREAGKSSLLAWLSQAGQPIVCDDVLVVDGLEAFAGPRSLDLRAAAAEALGTGTPLGLVGARDRWRVVLPPVAPPLQLRGWVFLAWADVVDAVPVPPAERLTRLAACRAVQLPPADPGSLLRLAAMPGLELRRPRDWDQLPAAAACLLEAIG